MLRTIAFLIVLFASSAARSGTSGSLYWNSCSESDAKSTALALYSWIDDVGSTSEAIYKLRAEKILSPQMYARFTEAMGDFGTFFTPVSGRDFYLSKNVPIAITTIGTTNEKKEEDRSTKLTMIVTFDVSGGPPLKKTIVLTMSYFDDVCKIENAHNGNKWLLR